MPIEIVPVKAHRIDLSNVEDVDRERLKITFENGEELFFRVDLRHAIPGLLLDAEQGNGRKLIETTSALFYHERVLRSRSQRFQDWRRKLVKPSYRLSFNGWTMEKVIDSIEVELDVGSDDYPNTLGIGKSLQVIYGTYYSDPYKVFTSWGKVVAIESITLPAISLAEARSMTRGVSAEF